MVNIISVALVRRVHGYSAEEMADLDILNLNHLDIEEIDNLEVFEQIRELHLQGNAIRVVENLEFLGQLELLDLSYNNIDSAGLRGCLQRCQLPSSLRTLNLSGNTCADDEALLLELQEIMPDLGIIIGLEDEEEGEGGKGEVEDPADQQDDLDDEEKINDGEDEVAFSSLSLSAGPLDADEILKSIVERKCRVQYVTPDAANSLQNTIEVFCLIEAVT